MTETLVCSCCGHQKNEVHSVPSKLLSAIFLLCPTCKEHKHEPRFAVILAARSPEPPKTLGPVIVDRTYCGEKIVIGEVAKR